MATQLIDKMHILKVFDKWLETTESWKEKFPGGTAEAITDTIERARCLIIEEPLIGTKYTKRNNRNGRNDRITKHEEICKQLNETYEQKNHDYGNSFKKVRDIMPNAIAVRLLDKANRIAQLMQDPKQMVKDESIEDTLKDIANYAIMELIERKIEKEKENE